MATLLSPLVAVAEDRLALVVGHNIGTVQTDPLRFAEADAERVFAVLLELGDFSDDSELLLAPTEEELAQAMTRLAERASATDDTTILFYFSGHGDVDTIHLGNTRVARDDVFAWLGQAGADLTLMVFDACQTPTAGQARGVGAGPSFDIGVVEGESVTGTVVIASTQEGLPALESESLGGALFTHFFVSGLRGAADVNADGRVTLAEAYGHAYDHTIRQSAGSSAVIQRPTFDLDLAGRGELVLTSLDWGEATLELPGGRESRVLIYQQPSGAMIAELVTSEDNPTRVAVPAGRLLLQRRLEAEVQLAEVSVGFDEVLVVEDDWFDAQPYDEVTLRGGRYELYPHRLFVGYRTGADRVSDSWVFRHGPRLEYAYSWLDWRLGVGVTAGFASYDEGLFSNTETYLELDTTLSWLTWVGPSQLTVFLGPMVRWIHQDRERLDRERLLLGGISEGDVTQTAVGAGPMTGVTWYVPFSQQLGLNVRIDGGIWLVNIRETVEDNFSAAPFMGVSLSLGGRF